MDLQQKGYVTRKEYVQMRHSTVGDQLAGTVFDAMDTDKKGKVTVSKPYIIQIAGGQSYLGVYTHYLKGPPTRILRVGEGLASPPPPKCTTQVINT